MQQRSAEADCVRATHQQAIARAEDARKSLKAEVQESEENLLAERKAHLATTQELTAVRRQLREAETALEGRVGDALSDLADKRAEIEDLQASVLMEKEELDSTRDEMSSMVSKTQLLEMEKLFNETVGMLTSRIQDIEGGGGDAQPEASTRKGGSRGSGSSRGGRSGGSDSGRKSNRGDSSGSGRGTLDGTEDWDLPSPRANNGRARAVRPPPAGRQAATSRPQPGKGVSRGGRGPHPALAGRGGMAPRKSLW
jgi:hypothetical protein